jgi:hypothetical protein
MLIILILIFPTMAGVSSAFEYGTTEKTRSGKPGI